MNEPYLISKAGDSACQGLVSWNDLHAAQPEAGRFV